MGRLIGKAERSLRELYGGDPERADALAWGRRGALRGAALAAVGAALGAAVPFGRRLPRGLLPAALAQPSPAAGDKPAVLRIKGKAPLVLLGERPLVAETPETMLDDEVTPAAKMYVRNNGGLPEAPSDPRAWKLRIEGEVERPLEIAVGELEGGRFPLVTRRLQLECGGNGRSFFAPEARGNQWGNGGVSCGEWTGVRLADLLRAAGLREGAKFTGHFGADPHLSGDPSRQALSRGMRIEKAMDENTLVAFRLNGEPIPLLHGAPLRLVVPGWPGSLSQKWLTRILLRPTPHDGAGMGGTSYRLPVRPIVPGSRDDGRGFADMESMPVRSVLTSHAHGARLPAGTRALDLSGKAWAGDLAVRAVHVSTDFGATWHAMAVREPANRHAWQMWSGRVSLPSDGYFELWYRATDSGGRMQPHAAANWNPQGYGANPISRAAVLVG
jgi:sulfite oxidase